MKNIMAAIIAVQTSAYTMAPVPATPVTTSAPTMTSMGTQQANIIKW